MPMTELLPKPSGPEYQLMISGQLYAPDDPELQAYRNQTKHQLWRFNHAAPGPERIGVLAELFGSGGEGAYVEPWLHVDYGCNIHVGRNFYANANCVLLDVAEIRIGDDVMLAPMVGLYTATHPVDPQERISGRELGYPITLGDRVWLGGGVSVAPGVTIGADTVVGAGSVVTKDLPPRVVAVGNPARVIRTID